MKAGERDARRTSKAEQSRATRGRIIAAATALFLRDGFVTTTMAAIAREAGVVVQTLYLSFGSKHAILQASFDAALKGGDDADGILESGWFRGVLAETDGPTATRLFCQGASPVISRAAPLYEVIRTAAADLSVAEIYAKNKQERDAGFRLVTEAIAGREGFNEELSVAEAHTILYTVMSEDTYLLMVVEAGWTPQRWVRWGTETCVHQFFPDRTPTH